MPPTPTFLSRVLLRLFVVVVFTGAARSVAYAQDVISLSWPTRHAAPPPSATGEGALYLPLARASITRLPEPDLVNLALRRFAALGISDVEASRLRDAVSRRYRAMEASPVFKSVPSLLGYSFSEQQPAQGRAWLYRPPETTAHTPVILFVHGSGGAFLWYLHQLAEWFPDHLILCPAYGVDPSAIAPAYLAESLAAASQRLQHPLAKPTLIGFSAGGFGACRAYAAKPAAYKQLIILAAYPPDDAFKVWPKSARAGFLTGEREDYVKDGGMATYSKYLAALSTAYEQAVIPKADQLFLFTHPQETRRYLQTWMQTLAQTNKP